MQQTLLTPRADYWVQRNRTLLSYEGNKVVQLKQDQAQNMTYKMCVRWCTGCCQETTLKIA